MAPEFESVCACKGARFCALCRDSPRVKALKFVGDPVEALKTHRVFVFSPTTGLCHPAPPGLSLASSLDDFREAAGRAAYFEGETISIDGLLFIRDFLSSEEENALVSDIETVPWVLSQSGRRKQDYGPKVNFKHKKVKCEAFRGVPEYADRLLAKMDALSGGKLAHYQPFELCNLEYNPERLAAIELHFDDMWIWGNRLISLNLLSDAVMTFEQPERKILVFVYMEQRALLSMFDEARYEWRHGIFPHHVTNRRIALTMREPSGVFQPGGELYDKYGKELIERGNIRLQIH